MWNLEITVWQAERESKTIYVENRKVMTQSKIGSGNLYNPVQNHKVLTDFWTVDN